jgi:prevent-host-death family protein
MKSIPLREAKTRFSELVDRCQEEQVLVTRHGRPAAVLLGVQGRDFEDVLLMFDKTLHRDLSKRAGQETYAWNEVMAELGESDRIHPEDIPRDIAWLEGQVEAQRRQIADREARIARLRELAAGAQEGTPAPPTKRKARAGRTRPTRTVARAPLATKTTR